MLTTLIGLACLAGCGDQPAFPDPGKVTLPAASPVVMPAQMGVTVAGIPAASEPPITGAVTSVMLQNMASTGQTGAPFSFGQVFVAGDLNNGEALAGRFGDGSEIALQLDIKARHPDGSVRHALVSGLAPALAPGQWRSMGLVKIAAAPAPPPTGPSALLDAGFSSSATVTLNGLAYSASADDLLRQGSYSTWLSGAQVNEWLVHAPLRTASGMAHPHLSARFAIRAYSGASKARVDVTIENNWAYEPAPQNFVYDVTLAVGGAPVYTKAGMTHYHHARWRKLFWWGAAPQLHIRHDSAYLIATRAVPNYDRSVVIPEATLAAMQSGWSGAKTEPMGVGAANPYMPSTGGRGDIGLLPSWAATYLLSMDKRAKDVTLGTADLAGSWSAHYRDKQTGRPVSLMDYPYMTLLGVPGDAYNHALNRSESFPLCATATGCTKVNTHDTSHQPGFAYLPYLVTGDYYYLEELQFWTMFNTFVDNPGYRENIKGLFKPDQVRGQAWSMRTLAQAAYITPDADPLKAQFNYFLSTNLAWYDANYTNNPSANTLGALAHGYAIVYNSNTGLAPWMDDFFTSAIGYAVELGFEAARPLLAWKAKFPVARMQASGACWIDAAMMSLKVRDSASAPIYASVAQAYQASHTPDFNALPCAGSAMASALSLQVGEMTGYSATVIGYPSNLQPALAYSAGVSTLPGASAWATFMQRSVRPNYGTGPQFAIIPR